MKNLKCASRVVPDLCLLFLCLSAVLTTSQVAGQPLASPAEESLVSRALASPSSRQLEQLERRYARNARQLETESPEVERGFLSGRDADASERRSRLLAFGPGNADLLRETAMILDKIERLRGLRTEPSWKDNGGGSISGTLTDQETGLPIANELGVRLFDAAGVFIDMDFTDANGAYFFGGLPAGTYLITANLDDYFDEVYDDILCPFYECEITDGTPIQVAAGVTTADIDFALSTAGEITGTVLDEDMQLPVAHALGLRLYDSIGRFYGDDFTDENGNYRFAGLPTGTYFMRTDSNDYFDELYDEIPCPNGCIETQGTPISVTFGETTSGIDFSLSSGGAIFGTVTAQGSWLPIGHGLDVELYDTEGGFMAVSLTDADGEYSFAGLPTGSYFVRTDIDGYFDEIYDGVPCPGDCDVTAGTPVDVVAGEATRRIDFSLATGGAISGTVSEAGTGLPVASQISVEAWDAEGAFITDARTDGAGAYRIAGLPAGTYYVRTNFGDYFDELYDGIPCPLSCDVTKGSPVAVMVDTTTSGIDFSLSAGGALRGTITDQESGLPLGTRFGVWLYDASGTNLDVEITEADGVYEFAGLPTGTYFVRAAINDYLDELYDDVPCPLGCDVTSGTPIDVTFGAIVSGIDFALGRVMPLFEDDFESGDATAWSTLVP